jgi:hypothetical protein
LKLTKKAAQAFTNLRGNPDFDVVLDWLRENRTSFRDECCTLPPEKVQRSQGKVEVVDGILKATKEAPATLEKIQNNERNTP